MSDTRISAEAGREGQCQNYIALHYITFITIKSLLDKFPVHNLSAFKI